MAGPDRRSPLTAEERIKRIILRERKAEKDMRKIINGARLTALAAAAALALLLGGCESYPEKAADGSDWNREWTILGRVAGVETDPGHGFVLSENPVVLTGSDSYYATWAVGEARPFTNEEGRETDLYDAQVYMLVYGNDVRKGEDPQGTLKDWMDRERGSYRVQEEREETRNGQPYSMLIYDCGSAANPYSRGISAFGLFGNYVVIAELTCTEDFQGDEQALLGSFLDGCHYGSENLKQP